MNNVTMSILGAVHHPKLFPSMFVPYSTEARQGDALHMSFGNL